MSANTTIRFATLFLLAASSSALAQPWTGQAPDDQLGEFSFELFAGGEYLVDTSISSGGRFEVTRAAGGFSLFTDPEEAFSINLEAMYIYDDYSINRGSIFFQPQPVLGVAEPWDEIHTYGATLTAMGDLNREFTLFGGGVFNFSGDQSARWDDAITGGGFVGLIYNVSKDLSVGGGVGALYQIEDDFQIFPIFYLDWQIANDLAVRSVPVSMAGTRWTSVELVFSIDKHWDIAAGGGYDFRRFRLDSQADAPRGVGELDYIPFWGRLAYRPNPGFTASVYISAAVEGQIGLANNDGQVIDKADFSSALVIGGNLSFRF
jgi:hypothetical protein